MNLERAVLDIGLEQLRGEVERCSEAGELELEARERRRDRAAWTVGGILIAALAVDPATTEITVTSYPGTVPAEGLEAWIALRRCLAQLYQELPRGHAADNQLLRRQVLALRASGRTQLDRWAAAGKAAAEAAAAKFLAGSSGVEAAPAGTNRRRGAARLENRPDVQTLRDQARLYLAYRRKGTTRTVAAQLVGPDPRTLERYAARLLNEESQDRPQ